MADPTPNPVADPVADPVPGASAEAGPEYYAGEEHCSTVYEDVCTQVTDQNCQTKYKVKHFSQLS